MTSHSLVPAEPQLPHKAWCMRGECRFAAAGWTEEEAVGLVKEHRAEVHGEGVSPLILRARRIKANRRLYEDQDENLIKVSSDEE